MNILVVDDEKNIRLILKRHLEKKGHHVVVYDKYEGLDMGGYVDAYMLDHDIVNGMTGYEWLQKVGEEQIPHYKRILMSGGPKWFQHDLSGNYLMKPFDIRTLDDMLAKVETEVDINKGEE